MPEPPGMKLVGKSLMNECSLMLTSEVAKMVPAAATTT